VDERSSETWAVRGRLFWGPSERLALVPLLSYERDQRPVWSESVEDVADRDDRVVRAGLGLDLFPSSDVMVLLSGEFRDREWTETGRGESDTDVASWRLQTRGFRLRLAVEARAASWLTLRAGARQTRSDRDQTLTQTEAAGGESLVLGAVGSELDLTLGLGFHFGGFDADLAVDDEAPFALGYVLTGAETEASSTFTSISLVYSF
jgi:hypothetical protein